MEVTPLFNEIRLPYFKKCVENGDLDLAMEFVELVVETEKLKYAFRLDDIESRLDKLENIQVTRQEFDDLKVRVEILTKAQRNILETILRV